MPNTQQTLKKLPKTFQILPNFDQRANQVTLHRDDNDDEKMPNHYWEKILFRCDCHPVLIIRVY